MTSSESHDNCYQVLKVAPDAPLEVIRAAWRALCAMHHPDRRPDDPQAQLHMTRINRAYEVLSDSEQRARHDREWCRQPSRPLQRPYAPTRTVATTADTQPSIAVGWQPSRRAKRRRIVLTSLAAALFASVAAVLILAWMPHEPEHAGWQQTPSTMPLDMAQAPSHGYSDRLRLALELAHQPAAESPMSAKSEAR